ncbi:MAG: DUF5110 domain-containing protein [Lactobacillales bacterium]|nr:DUF5110 domain-containing protein [Lactobacillales bacterium]
MNEFVSNYNRSKAKPENIIQGDFYRFTILSEKLIRLEYSETGMFVDKPTQFAIYRDNDKVNFEKQENDKYLLIRTKYFQVTYLKNKPFGGGKVNPIANLKVELLNSDKIWYYGHPEVRNYGSPSVSIENSNYKLKLKRGIYSIDGFSSVDDSNSYLINESNELIKREGNNIDIYLFMYLNDYLGCLNDYYKLTGYPPLIPRYALGNWWSRGVSYNDNSIKELIDEFSEKEIPLSILLLDKGWHVNNYENKLVNSGFSWNYQNFINPPAMINYLHSKGIRLGLNVDPSEGIYPFERSYETFRQLDINGNTIVPFNVFDINYINTYFNCLIDPLKNNDGVDFFWLDVNDATNKDMLWAMDYYHYQYGALDYRKRPFLMTRNSNIAEHRYPVTYSGKTIVSWDTLKLIPKYNMLATNNGNSFWAHDIGGYHKGMEDNELYTRFVQLGTFSPILKFGSADGKFYKREPWRWSYKTYKITKDYLKLRHNLIPYLYSEAYKYHKHGKPLIIPLYYEQPEAFDDPIYNSEYFFGSEFFISPILKVKDYVMNRVIHRFYLPAGTWYDYVTGKRFAGGKQYLSFFKDQDYPVYVKAGAIIPLGHNENPNDTTPPKKMEIQIFPGKSNTYKLYEDDGVSELYKKGYYLLTSIDYTYVKNNYTVIVRPLEGKSGIIPDTRNYKFNFRNTKFANDVIVYINNTKVEFNKYSKNTSFIVEVNDVPTTSQLTVICKGNDIEISAERIFMDDIESIISDLQIDTVMKEKIDEILNRDDSIKKKRIAIRKLEGQGLERKFIKLFLKLLEYLELV